MAAAAVPPPPRTTAVGAEAAPACRSALTIPATSVLYATNRVWPHCRRRIRNATVLTTPSARATPRTSSTSATMADLSGMVTDRPRQEPSARTSSLTCLMKSGRAASVTSMAE